MENLTMEQLQRALHGLAETSHPPIAGEGAPGATGPELWSRGRRRVRTRRWVAAGAVAVLVVGVGALGSVTMPTGDVAPAEEVHGPAVPRRVVAPPEDLVSTTEAGPPGVVAVLGGMYRDGSNGLFTISATTGEYRALDLPGATELSGGLDDAPPALAPDGRHIAFGVAGTPSGEPYPGAGTAPDRTPIGFAVYDTGEGTVRQVSPATEHGLSLDGFVWLDADTVLVTYGQRTSPTAARDIATYRWDLGEDPIRLRGGPLGSGLLDSAPLGRTPDGAPVLASQGPGIVVLGPDGRPDAGRRWRLPAGSGFEAITAWIGARTAVLEGNAVQNGTATDAGPRMARLEGEGRLGRAVPIAGLRLGRVLGWLDAHRMLALGAPAGTATWGSFYELDTRTGRLTALGTADGGSYSPGLQVATDLLTAPLVDGTPPAADADRRGRLVGSALAVVVCTALAGALIRRWRRV